MNVKTVEIKPSNKSYAVEQKLKAFPTITKNTDLQRSAEVSKIWIESDNFSELQKLRGKPFWMWDIISHKEKHRTHKGNCCFNHIIGLPAKDGIEKPMFDYEAVLYRALVIEFDSIMVQDLLQLFVILLFRLLFDVTQDLNNLDLSYAYA